MIFNLHLEEPIGFNVVSVFHKFYKHPAEEYSTFHIILF